MSPSSGQREDAYLSHAAALRAKLGTDAGLSQAVGGEFEAIGFLELELLKSCGMTRDAALIDVGCGAGRLTRQLRGWFLGSYLGTDVVPELVEHARSQVPERPDWRFEVVEGSSIPALDAAAEVVCFFSVLTHVLHEEAFRYLREACRVLRPGGIIVLSFLEFRVPSHWAVFEPMIAADGRGVHNQFLDRDALRAFADHLGLRVEGFFDGDTPHIPLSRPVRWDDGRIMVQEGCLGQSVCVLRASPVEV